MKIEDGNIDLTYSAVMEILEQVGIEAAEIKLDRFHHPKRLNTAGVVVGHYTHDFKLSQIKGQKVNPG